MKWTIATRIANSKRGFGYVSPRFMELIQHGYYLMYKKWLSYTSPKFIGSARSSLFAFFPFDKGMRKIAWNFAKSIFRNPSTLFRKAYFQTITVIQPVDMMSDGGMNMCDGCPDITVHKGKLYWSCRLEEIKTHGTFVNAVPRQTSCQRPQAELQL